MRAVYHKKIQRKVEDYAERAAFFKDATHRLHPTRLGRETAEFIAGAQAAKKLGKPDVDKCVCKSAQTPEIYSMLTREVKSSQFWEAFEVVAVKTAREAGIKSLSINPSLLRR